MERKEMSIKFEDKQCEVRIPQEFRKKLKLTNKHYAVWTYDEDTGELFCYVIKGNTRYKKRGGNGDRIKF